MTSQYGEVGTHNTHFALVKPRPNSTGPITETSHKLPRSGRYGLIRTHNRGLRLEETRSTHIPQTTMRQRAHVVNIAWNNSSLEGPGKFRMHHNKLLELRRGPIFVPKFGKRSQWKWSIVRLTNGPNNGMMSSLAMARSRRGAPVSDCNLRPHFSGSEFNLPARHPILVLWARLTHVADAGWKRCNCHGRGTNCTSCVYPCDPHCGHVHERSSCNRSKTSSPPKPLKPKTQTPRLTNSQTHKLTNSQTQNPHPEPTNSYLVDTGEQVETQLKAEEWHRPCADA
jgi:hypothetical protein